MRNFKWKLNNKIINNLARIERIYGRLEGMKLPEKLWLNLERNQLIQSSYISNSIEGNPLSLPEVTNLLLGDRMPVNRDEKEVYNYFTILKNLSGQTDSKISLDFILKLHAELLAGVDDKIAGKIRNKKVVVGGYKNIDGRLVLKIKHEPPTHSQKEIKKELRELCEWMEKEEISPIVKIALFHHQFVFIHPFIDGNGRTCRLLTAFLFLKHGYQINKYFVLDDWYDVDRKLYSDSLHSADYQNQTEWIEYFTDGVKYSLQSALVKAKNAVATLNVDERLTTQEKRVLKIAQELREFVTNDVADKLQVSRQQAHMLLSSLVKKGLLEKRGKTKSSRYVLK
jgi:Fic family protein